MFIPTAPTLEHLRTAIDAPGFWHFARNSLVLTVGAVLIALLIALASAWASTRYFFKGRKAFLISIMAAQLAPWEAMLIPIFIVYRDTGGLDVLLALIPLYMVMVLPFTVWTLRGFIAAVPVELEEAAMVDGCTRGQAFRADRLPAARPGLIATSLFGFITVWNEFLFVNALMQGPSRTQTLPLWLSAFQTVFGTDWGATMAASTLFALPVVIFFLILQRSGRRRPHRRRGEGMSDVPIDHAAAPSTDTLTRDALAVLQPGFTGHHRPRLAAAPARRRPRLGRPVRPQHRVARAARRAHRRSCAPSGDDVLVAIDEEGGDVTRLEVRDGSSFPGNLALGAVDDVDLTRAVAARARPPARRAAASTSNWAPSADVNSNPDNPVIGVRSFGADPDLVARHTAAYVAGLQSAGVAACAKHFPGHGDTARRLATTTCPASMWTSTPCTPVSWCRSARPSRPACQIGDERAHPACPPRPGPPRHAESARSSPACSARSSATTA